MPPNDFRLLLAAPGRAPANLARHVVCPNDLAGRCDSEPQIVVLGAHFWVEQPDALQRGPPYERRIDGDEVAEEQIREIGSAGPMLLGIDSCSRNLVPMLIHDQTVAEDEIAVGVSVKVGNLALDFVRQEEVVGIEEDEELGGRSADAAVTRRTRVAGIRLPEIPNTVTEFCDDLCCRVGGPVVDDDDLDIPKALRQSALDGLANQ